MNISTLNPQLTADYDGYLLTHDSSLFYHSSRYKDFLKHLLGCEEEYLVAQEGGRVCGVLPLLYMKSDGRRVYNSLPYYGSNGGVLADDPTAFRQLVDAYNEIAGSEKTISATIVGNPFAQPSAPHVRHNFKDYRIGQFTRLSSQPEELLARIDSSAMRNQKKAVREGIRVEVDHAQLESLRQIHQENIQAINGLAKTEPFFKLVPEHFRPGTDFDLYVAKKEGCVIAALLLFYFNRTVEYFTPAVASDYRSMQPLALILIQAMTDAARRGFKWWNWGGTWRSQTGVYRFKKKWGAEEQEYFYYTQLNDRSLLNWNAEALVRAFRHFFVVPFSNLHLGGGSNEQ